MMLSDSCRNHAVITKIRKPISGCKERIRAGRSEDTECLSFQAGLLRSAGGGAGGNSGGLRVALDVDHRSGISRSKVSMSEDSLREWIEQEADWEFSRSGGPGGQNVNKVNTRATLRVGIDRLPVDDASKERVREKLSNRITGEGELLIHASEGRSQSANRRAAVNRAASLLSAALRRQKRRKPTRPSKGAKERRIDAKKLRGRQKQNRRPPEPE